MNIVNQVLLEKKLKMLVAILIIVIMVLYALIMVYQSFIYFDRANVLKEQQAIALNTEAGTPNYDKLRDQVSYLQASTTRQLTHIQETAIVFGLMLAVLMGVYLLFRSIFRANQ